MLFSFVLLPRQLGDFDVFIAASIHYLSWRCTFAGRLLIIVMPILIRNYSRVHYRNSIIGLMSVNMKLLTIVHVWLQVPNVAVMTAKTRFVHITGKCNNFPSQHCPVTVKDKFKLENSYRWFQSVNWGHSFHVSWRGGSVEKQKT